MNNSAFNTYTSFEGFQRIASGPLQEVALAVKRAIDSGASERIVTFEDATGRLFDIDTNGSEQEVLARLPQPEVTASSPEPLSADLPSETHRERGRPKLGVVAREVTLLPRHWEWLATQPGGASVALRKLVDEARRTHAAKDKARHAQERAYRFMSTMAGNLPGFEEASRALFANDKDRFVEHIAAWSDDMRDYVTRLAFGDDDTTLS